MASPQPKDKVNIKQYSGLVDNIIKITNQVEHERAHARDKEQSLQDKLKHNEDEASSIQKELSVQLRCAGRSYQSLLGATRDLTEQLRSEEERRQSEIQILTLQVKELKAQLNQAAKPWKEEVSKRDLKIIKLQERATEQDASLRDAVSQLRSSNMKFEKDIKTKEEAHRYLLKEMTQLNKEMAEERDKFEDELEVLKANNKSEVFKWMIQLEDAQELLKTAPGPYVKTIKELEMKVAGLEHQLAEVDYTPLERALDLKDVAYKVLVNDFHVKSEFNGDSVDKMRREFEEVIEALDAKIQNSERDFAKRTSHWPLLVKEKEAEIKKLTRVNKELRENESTQRRLDAEMVEGNRKELDAAKAGVVLLNEENTRLRRDLAKLKDDDDDEEGTGSGSMKKKLMKIELMYADVVRKFELMVRQKDREIGEKTDIVTNLQHKVAKVFGDNQALDTLWDGRVQIKEEGYGLVTAQLQYAEGQILEERRQTELAVNEINRKKRLIEQLKLEHEEELATRLVDHEALDQKIRDMEAEREMEPHLEDVIRLDWEAKCAYLREMVEERVADLRVEVARKERALRQLATELAQVKLQFEKARESWDEKEREYEGIIRARDRAVAATKNEIEFINDSWEIKYARLLSQFEKLQKKYEEMLGPGGVAESLRRARDLKVENQALLCQINQCKEVMKKQKRQIRELQLDVDVTLKDTADLISQKERGIAEMIGDYAKLEQKYRDLEDLKERVTKERVSEKRELVASFQPRVEQLEQLVEAMRFTDRQELLDKIDTWKHAYERICVARDDMEDQFKDQLHTKDIQLKKMADENIMEKENVETERELGIEKSVKVEEKYKKLLVVRQMEKEQVEKELIDMTQLKNHAETERSRALRLADSRLVDPEKDELRQLVARQEEEKRQLEAGAQLLIKETNEKEAAISGLKAELEVGAVNWEPQIKWRDERYEAMLKEHEQVKQILALEMKKAQDTCKLIEEQIRKFPNPFEDEILEMRDKYSQMQAGMRDLLFENLKLREQLQDVKDSSEAEITKLDANLALAQSILSQVAGIGSLKSMSKADADQMEQHLGMNVEGERKASGRRASRASLK